MTMKNPITELTGPEFLLFYGIVIVVTVAFCWWRRNSSDTTASLPLPLIPECVDPYELAYLRGGENEVTRVVIVRLTELAYLCLENKKEYKNGSWQESSDKEIVQQSSHAPAKGLSELERC